MTNQRNKNSFSNLYCLLNFDLFRMRNKVIQLSVCCIFVWMLHSSIGKFLLIRLSQTICPQFSMVEANTRFNTVFIFIFRKKKRKEKKHKITSMETFGDYNSISMMRAWSVFSIDWVYGSVLITVDVSKTMWDGRKVLSWVLSIDAHNLYCRK